MGDDELCSLPGWVRRGREWRSLDTGIRLEITQVTTPTQTLINKNFCLQSQQKQGVSFNYSSEFVFQGSEGARMSVWRGESRRAGTR